jgi:serine/threonine protein kinase
MVCGYLPFEEETNEKLYKKIYSTKLEIPGRISSQCKDLLNKLLVVNPRKRPSLEEIKNHKFLNYGVIWYKEHFSKIMKKYDLKKENINMDILDNMNQYGIDDLKENIINDILNNKRNRNTMIYYLLLDKYGVDWKYLKDSTTKLLVAKPSFSEKIKQKTLIEEDELECNLIDYISNISNNKQKKEETKNKVKEKREKLKHNNISYTQREMKSKLNISKNKNKDKENSLYLVNLKKKLLQK